MLATACEYGNVDIVSYLISKGVDVEGKDLPEETPNRDYYAPLFLAQHGKHKKIVQLLLNAGAVPRKMETNIKRYRTRSAPS